MKRLHHPKFVIIIFLSLSSLIYSQEISKVILLSDGIGTILDAEERKEYQIFNRLKENFKSAFFFMSPDTNFYCRVTFQSGDFERDSTFSISYYSIKTIAGRIQYKENKVGEFNIDNVILKYADGKKVEKKTQILSNKQKVPESSSLLIGELPLQTLNLDHKRFIGRTIRFGLSAGTVYNTTKFAGLLDIINLIEENIPKDGYSIPKTETDFAIPPLFRFSSFFLIKNSIVGEIDYSFNIYSGDYRNIDYNSFTVSLGYQFSVLPKFSPYIKLGYTAVNFTFAKSYNLIVINQSDHKLESITLNGNAKGFKISGGIIYDLSYSVGINLFIDYSFLKNVKVNENYHLANTPSASLSSFGFGLSLSIKN